MDLDSIHESQKVWVGNMPTEATSEDLDTHFRQLSQPLVSRVLRPGMGVVAYETVDEAQMAISAFNGSEIGGANIETDAWAARMPAKPKGGGKKGGKTGGGKGPGGKGPGGKGMMGGMDGWGSAVASIMKGFGGWGAGGGKGGGWGDSWGATSGGTEVHWIAVPPQSAIVAQGLPNQAPVAVYQKGDDVFGSAAYILGELVGEITEEVQIIHDGDWEQFPEIGQAIKRASREEHCFAVAICPNRGAWGVGAASGWKTRESSSKLGLALALIAQDPSVVPKLFRNYPELRPVCQAQGLMPGFGGGCGGFGGFGGFGGGCGGGGFGGGCGGGFGGCAGGGFGGCGKGGKAKGGGGGGDMGGGGDSSAVPPVHVIALQGQNTLTAAGFPAEAPAIGHPGKTAKEFFSNAHSILQELVEDVTSDVSFEDDPEWTKLPEVGQALKAAGTEEDCYCVASCASAGCWGVGLGAGWKSRESSCKLALALALAQSAGRLEEMAQKYPEFGQVGAAAGLCEPPRKKRRAGW